jgi:hypothetical protein
MPETVHGISKAKWESLDPEQQTQIERAARDLDVLVSEALTESDLDLFIDPADRVPTPQHQLWQRLINEQDEGLLPSQPDRRGIVHLEAMAKAALSPDGLDLNAPVESDPAQCGYCEPGEVCEPNSIFDTPCEETCCATDEAVAPGDQPPPVQNDGVAIQSLVIEDVEARLRIGIQRYGTPLQANNGRDALWDAYQEALDLVVYLRQMIAERDGQ